MQKKTKKKKGKRKKGLTRKIAVALESKGRCSGNRLFPLKIRHCISVEAALLNPFSRSFLFIVFKPKSGIILAPANT